MKVLVTGANGYLGKGIVKELLDEGVEVIATDIREDLIDKRANIFVTDIFSLNDPYHYFEEPDVVLHLAWRDGFIHNSDKHIKDLYNHYIFLKKLIDSEIKQLAVLGSMHEVGFYEGSIDEKTETKPQTFYGISKDSLRKYLEVELKNSDIIFQWLRAFYIVGNSIDGSSIFSKIVQAEEEGKQIFPFTMGKNQFDFLDYDIFCKYIAMTIRQSEVSGIINVCSGYPQRLSDRVEKFISDNNFNIKLKYGAFPDRPYDSKAIWGNNSKINKIESMFKNRLEQ